MRSTSAATNACLPKIIRYVLHGFGKVRAASKLSKIKAHAKEFILGAAKGLPCDRQRCLGQSVLWIFAPLLLGGFELSGGLKS